MRSLRWMRLCARENDEFVKPTVIGPYAGIADGDAVSTEDFQRRPRTPVDAGIRGYGVRGFAPARKIHLSAFVTLTEYSADLPVTGIAYASQSLHTRSRISGRTRMQQLRIAETEKYAHVTFFFSGGASSVCG